MFKQSYMEKSNVMRGACSWFGGINDNGVRSDEGLALVSPEEAVTPFFKPLFVATLIPTAGLARQLSVNAMYCAMRWEYDVYSRAELQNAIVRVSTDAGKVVWVRPVDYGPAFDTGRIIDLSHAAMNRLGVVTDQFVNVQICT